MKCPKCEFTQSDQNAECKRCGIIFEKYNRQASAKIVVYEEDASSSWKRLLFPAILLSGVIITAVALRSPHRNMANSPASLSTTEHERTKSVGARKAGDALCMKNLRDMGVPEDQAKAQCLEDQEAKERVENVEHERQDALNFVPVEQVARMELLLKGDPVSPSDRSQNVHVRLLLYNAEGETVSSQGQVQLEVESTENIRLLHDGKSEISANAFRLAYLEDEREHVVFTELPSLYVSREKPFEISLHGEFAGKVSSSASLRIEAMEQGHDDEQDRP